MYTFGSVSLYSLIANIIILPLVPVIMFVTFLVILTAPFLPYVANLLGYIATLLGNTIIFVARFIESLPFSYISVSIHIETMVLMYVCAGLLFYFYVNRFSFVTKNETPITKDDEIISEIISY
jgi:predicted membrane metal-binding protein